MPSFPTESELFPAGDLQPATAKAKFLQWLQATIGLLGSTGNASDARSALGATTVGNALFTAADAAAARSAVGSAASGSNADITALTNLASINGGQLAGFRNKLINSLFQINQRSVAGTVTLGAGIYGHDRFKAGAGGCTYTYATSNGVTTITITAGTLQQVIEGNNLLSGDHVLSWEGTAQGRINSGSYGASGAVTANITGGSNCTVEWSTGTLRKPQFEPGTKATAFEQRNSAVEGLMCLRYCEVIPGSIGTLNPSGSTANISFYTKYRVAKRVNPTIVGIGGTVQQSDQYGVLSYANTAGLSWYFPGAMTISAEL